jgi:hypothetical protein
MKYVFTFNETNYGRLEVEADREPDSGELIEEILAGKADYNDTDFTDFRLIEVDGVAQEDNTSTWDRYLLYLRCWADSHGEAEFHGMTPACYDEWLGGEHQEEDKGFMCCLHDTPRTFDWCEENCDRYYSCDTVAQAGDEVGEDSGSDDTPGRFNVTITETLKRVVAVDAGSPDEAEQIVSDDYRASKHVLTAEDFYETEIDAFPAE